MASAQGFSEVVGGGLRHKKGSNESDVSQGNVAQREVGKAADAEGLCSRRGVRYL